MLFTTDLSFLGSAMVLVSPLLVFFSVPLSIYTMEPLSLEWRNLEPTEQLYLCSHVTPQMTGLDSRAHKDPRRARQARHQNSSPFSNQHTTWWFGRGGLTQEGILGGICVASSDKELKSRLKREPGVSWRSQMSELISQLHPREQNEDLAETSASHPSARYPTAWP